MRTSRERGPGGFLTLHSLFNTGESPWCYWAAAAAGRFRSVPVFDDDRLNIISCPSCSRVENDRFVELAEAVKAMTAYAEKERLTIAVMGCRVNGPGETDGADLGLWCGPTHVNLKRGGETIGAFSYEEILPRLKQELDALIARKGQAIS